MEQRDELWPDGPCFYYDTVLFPPGTDSFALAYFARPARGDTVCDLGSGTGLLGTLLLAREDSLIIENVELSAPAAALASGEVVKSPMPGNILKINVAPGQKVEEGDVLIVLEAMKMENEIVATKAGTVAQVAVSKGAVVETGTPLVVIA